MNKKLLVDIVSDEGFIILSSVAKLIPIPLLGYIESEEVRYSLIAYGFFSAFYDLAVVGSMSSKDGKRKPFSCFERHAFYDLPRYVFKKLRPQGGSKNE